MSVEDWSVIVMDRPRYGIGEEIDHRGRKARVVDVQPYPEPEPGSWMCLIRYLDPPEEAREA